MCDVKNRDEIRRDFPSLGCGAGIYFLEKRSRFGHSSSFYRCSLREALPEKPQSARITVETLSLSAVSRGLDLLL